MPPTYDDIMASRRAQISPSVAAQYEVLSKAYKVAAQVMALRDRLGITQAELAKRSGLSTAEIKRIERGSAIPDEQTLRRIVDAAVGEPSSRHG